MIRTHALECNGSRICLKDCFEFLRLRCAVYTKRPWLLYGFFKNTRRFAVRVHTGSGRVPTEAILFALLAFLISYTTMKQMSLSLSLSLGIHFCQLSIRICATGGPSNRGCQLVSTPED